MRDWSNIWIFAEIVRVGKEMEESNQNEIFCEFHEYTWAGEDMRSY